MKQPTKLEIINYSTLDETYELFGRTHYIRVDTNLKGFLEQLDYWEEQYKVDNMRNGYTPKLFFRGVSEAKYNLYNSSQVYYISNQDKLFLPQVNIPNYDRQVNDHYDTFVSFLIEETIKSDQDSVQRFLAKNNFSKENALPFLSFMQHYGIPTPLLDFSLNKYASLFFAQDGISNTIATDSLSDNEIDNYFALYLVAEVTKPLLFMRENVHPELVQYYRSLKISYNQLGKSRLMVFGHNDNQFQMINNDRIIFQEGLFIYNSHITWPLEYHYFNIVNLQPSFQEVYNRVNPNFPIQDAEKKIGWCIHIHKRLIPELRDILIEKGITRDKVYPDKSLDRDPIITKVIERLRLRSELL